MEFVVDFGVGDLGLELELELRTWVGVGQGCGGRRDPAERELKICRPGQRFILT